MSQGGHDDTGETREMPIEELVLGASSPPPPPQDDTALGPRQPVLGDYVLLRRIGAGGSGRVFEARHRTMDRLVALKMLSPATMKDPEAVRRFNREMRAAARLFHPNIVTALDAGEQDGVHYLVMEYVDGQSLTALVTLHGPVTVDAACNYVAQAAKGLQYAHSHGVVHRDVKPSNLILDSSGCIKILDMGTARFQNEAPSSDLTQSGVIMGTINYMAPEQAQSASDVDHRSDIYSLGCTLYFLLTGQPLFNGNVMQVLLAHNEQAPPRVRDERPDVPQWLEDVLQRMLAKRPEQRQQSMNEVIAELEEGGARATRGADASALFSASSLRSGLRAGPARAVGIDLGACYSSIAFLNDAGNPVCLPCQGAPLVPTAVSIQGMNISVGRRALERLKAGGDVAWRIKRHLGRPLYPHELDGASYPPEVLLALLMCQLSIEARQQIGDFRQVVIAVPAMFNDVQRKAVEDAGFIAGLDVVDLINEPTAAALSHAFERGFPQSDPPQRWLVVDLGGGKLDAALLEHSGGHLATRGLSGSLELGGLDWDDHLANLVADQIVACDAPDPRLSPAAFTDLSRQCELARLQLSKRKETTLAFQALSQRVPLKVSRGRFQQLTDGLTRQVVFWAEAALAQGPAAWRDLNGVLLSGQATRMPAVRDALAEAAGGELPMRQLSSQAVACGAALHAAARLDRRRGREPRSTISDLSAHSVGVVGIDSRSGQRRNATLIPKGTSLPAATRRTFKTFRDGQDSVMVQILQGESELADQCTAIGKCVISDLPADLPAGTHVTVEFQCAPNGRLTIYVESPETGFRATKDIARESGLTNQQLTRWREWVETMTLCSNLS